MSAKSIVNDDVMLLPDGRSACRHKFQLLNRARHSMVASLNYGGGDLLQRWLLRLRCRMRDGGLQLAYVMSSDMFLTADNRTLIAAISTEFPQRFHWQCADRHTVSPVRILSNHCKCMVIDGGWQWQVGGSGLLDSYNWSLSAAGADVDSAADRGDGRLKILPDYYHDCDVASAADADAVDDADAAATANCTGLQLFHYLLDLARRWQCRGDRHSAAAAAAASVLQQMQNRHGRQATMTTGAAAVVLCTVAQSSLSASLLSGAVLHQTMCSAIRNARLSIHIAHLYTHWTDDLLKSLLYTMARHGTRVTIVTNGGDLPTPHSHRIFAGRTGEDLQELQRQWHQLLPPPQSSSGGAAAIRRHRQQLRIYRFHHARCTYHKKLLVVDALHTLCGNSNIGDKSLRWMCDDEVNVWVRNRPALANQAIASIEADIAWIESSTTSQAGSMSHRNSVAESAVAWAHRHLLTNYLG
jgi:phosphatidylserine/phosphatidylglycerophosphate/cardiolipin synthase-like enzyme